MTTQADILQSMAEQGVYLDDQLRGHLMDGAHELRALAARLAQAERLLRAIREHEIKHGKPALWRVMVADYFARASDNGPASLSEFVHASPQERERIGQGVVERAADQQAKVIADSG